ncbi:MAG TPA: roadblock/LC7 domain-containing protein [Longimicrobiales bacterium]|nr:roadblock/LC7 domain-containing protein [Longimicrobiales bacterium]
MSETFGAVVEQLSRIPGVRGAVIAEKDAGVAVVQELAEGVNGNALAALAASLFRRTAHAGRASGFGAVSLVQLEAAGGHLLAVEAGELVLVVVAEQGAQLGLIRLEAARAGKSLA